jgi:UDP-N-acetylglucosamine 2-epimerase (non-hydrolysing)
MKKIILVAGARPNFMKIAPIIRAMKGHPGLQAVLVHTGQHYDDNMSATFFKSLGIPDPDYNLQVGSGSHATQTADIMVKFEDVCRKEKPEIVMVVGDVNSTIAAGLTAKKLNILLAHVEAGLRSRDRTMPEEINRIATDSITDYFFTTEKVAAVNLLKEGHDPEAIHFVGHVMIDNLFFQLQNLSELKISPDIVNIKKKLPKKYICMTLHRPANVDNTENLRKILDAVKVISEITPVVFPIHPRTLKNIEQYSLRHLLDAPGIVTMQPLGYNDFLYLWKDAALVLTDSGGLQEETTALGIPCLTMRENTERPITAEIGSNIVVGSDKEKIIAFGSQAISGQWKKCEIPDLWDGKASERIVEILCSAV